jgi:acetyl/propionyl-CoA carboxylase alpha subunit
MRRALREYEVVGIRTTVPFFRWMLAQPSFETAIFHTESLDELLQQRQGEPFETPGEDDEQIAVIAAALAASATRAPSSRVGKADGMVAVPLSAGGETARRKSSWTSRARIESLRQ